MRGPGLRPHPGLRGLWTVVQPSAPQGSSHHEDGGPAWPALRIIVWRKPHLPCPRGETAGRCRGQVRAWGPSLEQVLLVLGLGLLQFSLFTWKQMLVLGRAIFMKGTYRQPDHGHWRTACLLPHLGGLDSGLWVGLRYPVKPSKLRKDRG